MKETLNKRRIEEGKSRIFQSTFYRFLENLMHNMGIDENDSYRWLKTQGIDMREKYSIENARASIQTPFSFRDLKNISVVDLDMDECMNLYQFMVIYQDAFNPKYFLLLSVILIAVYDWKNSSRAVIHFFGRFAVIVICYIAASVL